MKNTFGLSKYCKSTPLLNSVGIKSILQLYEENLILFLKQIKQNSFTKEVYEILMSKYELFQPARESFFIYLATFVRKII
jgi:hypothetical protein